MKALSGMTWLLFIGFVFVGCSNSSTQDIKPEAEIFPQQVGEVLTSIDEFSQGSGSLTTAGSLANPNLAQYSSCLGAVTWGSCETFGGGRKRTKTFNGCTLGSATLIGSIEFEYSGAGCALLANGQTVKRSPSFSMQFANRVEITIQKVGTNGQVLTRVDPTTFSFASDGIRRRLLANGSVLSDFTSATQSSMTLAGNLRAGRSINGGSLQVTNNISGVSCVYVPTAVTWTANCTCPTSGTWTFSCTDSSSGSITHTGCGELSVIEGGGAPTTVALNRCVGV
jgi:hypothetical protein